MADPLIIKICGIKTLEILETAIDAGADIVGFMHFARSPRHVSVDVIADDFAGSLAPFQDAVLAALDPEYTKYFAIAHPGRFSEYDFSEPIIEEARALEAKATERGMQLIGHFAIDETGYMSARARSYFDQYPRHDDLPRTMFHWAHSKLGKCG